MLELNSSFIWIFSLLWLLYFFDYIDRMVVVSLFPFLKAEWGLTDAQCGWLGTIYFIVVAALTIPAAILCM